jgi:hypothetical protein
VCSRLGGIAPVCPSLFFFNTLADWTEETPRHLVSSLCFQVQLVPLRCGEEIISGAQRVHDAELLAKRAVGLCTLESS